MTDSQTLPNRHPRAVIDLGALRHNLRRVREFAPSSQVFAAIKADAYGHGAIEVAAALSDADGLAVSSIDEALRLRWSGVTRQPIMLLSAFLDSETLTLCAQHNLEPVVFDMQQLPALQAYSGAPIMVWVKLDTGMHRLGIAPDDAPAAYAVVEQNLQLELAGWLTHLACADASDDTRTHDQMTVFERALEDLPGRRSIANSAGVTAWAKSHVDVVRPGIMLYGGSPLQHKTAQALDLQPVMTLTAPLLSVREVPAGEAVGYGAAWTPSQTTRVGVVGIGYGDGYPRHAQGAPVLVKGQRCTLVGRVSMDMITVDLSGCEQARLGDEVVLWGQGVPADEVAQASGTIAYELFCQLTGRVAFEYLR